MSPEHNDEVVAITTTVKVEDIRMLKRRKKVLG
jgi:hypothetical protein